MLSFGNPYWLLLLPVFTYWLWRIQKRSYAEASPLRFRIWFLLRFVLVVILLLALAQVQWSIPVRQSQIVFAIDLSDSITSSQRQKAIEWVNQAISKVSPSDQVGIVVFGTDAKVERFPASPRPLSTIDTRIEGTTTDFEKALQLSSALFAANYQKNLVLVTDGEDNTGEPESLLKAIKDQKVHLQALYLPPPQNPEAAVETLLIPAQVFLKQPFIIDTVTGTNTDTPAILELYRNGNLLQQGTVWLQKGKKQQFPLIQKIEEPGIYRYQVVLRPKSDTHTENNVKEGWVQVEGSPKLLIVDPKPEDVFALRRALENRGISVEVQTPDRFPSTLPEMLPYQAILIRNVPAWAIRSQMKALKKYVQDFAGGFGMLGGEQSFGPGGFYGTAVEEILPVGSDLINKQYLADVAMVVVIDKSGSMSYTERGRQKIDLADEGAVRVASLLKKTDRLGVLVVDSVPRWAYRLQQLANLQEAIDAIISIRAGGGGIYVYSGLQEAYSALAETKIPIKHVILFADTADCEEKEGPDGTSSLTLAQTYYRNHQITTTTIGIGKPGDIDVNFLNDLAVVGHGRFYFTSDMFTLPEIFVRESAVVQRCYILEERFTPVTVFAGEMMAGIPSPPDLLGYVATSPKPRATVALQSHRQEPVLAFWKSGLGHTLAFTSDPGTRWASLWLSWPHYERFWAQAARYLARSPTTVSFEHSFYYDGHNTVLVVDLPAQETTAQRFIAILTDPEGVSHEIRLQQVAPGRYQGCLPGKGPFLGKIFRTSHPGESKEEVIVTYSGPVNQEHKLHFSGKNRLQQLLGSASVHDSPENLRFIPATLFDLQPLLSYLLWLTAFWFFFDVAARKLQWPFARQTQQAVKITPLEPLKARQRIVRQQLDTPPDTLPVEKPGTPEQPITAPRGRHFEPEYIQRLKEAKRKIKQKEPSDQMGTN